MFSTTVRLATVFGALALLTSAVVAPAVAGGRKVPSSTISLVLVSASLSGDSTGGPRYGDSVTFAVSTDATKQPFVHLRCFQDKALVLEGWQGWFEGALGSRSFTLGGSPAWQGGAADCTAYLENWDSYSKNGRTTVLAATSFHVDA